MGTRSQFERSLDGIDLAILLGFASLVGGVALAYGLAHALMIFGVGLMTLGVVAMRMKR